MANSRAHEPRDWLSSFQVTQSQSGEKVEASHSQEPVSVFAKMTRSWDLIEYSPSVAWPELELGAGNGSESIIVMERLIQPPSARRRSGPGHTQSSARDQLIFLAANDYCGA